MFSRANGKISPEMVAASYEVGKQIYNRLISLKEGVNSLTKIGMNSNSAVDYVYNYSNLIQGKLFTRTTNSFATEYYLNRIYNEQGKAALRMALLSLSQHIDYYEEKSGSPVKKRREIYSKYMPLIDVSINDIVYPDEVEDTQKYSEGKTKQVLINTYERNPVARQLCIEHFGLKCQICDFSFEKFYGQLGRDFIHVHHKIELALIGEEYSVDPIHDLIPVCPNCHAMLHKRKPAYKVEEIKAILKL